MESYDQDNLFEPGFSVSNYFDLWARNFQGSVVPISYNAYNYILLKIQDPLNENFQYVLDDLINLAISGEKELFNFFFYSCDTPKAIRRRQPILTKSRSKLLNVVEWFYFYFSFIHHP